MTFWKLHDLGGCPKGAIFIPLNENGWENSNFEMLYLLTYSCYYVKFGVITWDIDTYNLCENYSRLQGTTIDFHP